ncbi:MAG: ATP-binding protein [Bacteroidales bacterium]|nr:ATP-binding protein [Bacteroidales bacterium]MCF8390809.1 ATP-binding protein [Bacteroidales bacterium]
MLKKIAIASGKGGTGKTTVSVNLYYFIHKYWTDKVQLLDCDVEEPNDLIFFPEAREKSFNVVNQQVPKIDNSKCTYCRDCVEYCEFNAIVVIPTVKFAEVNASLCHSCGACLHACKHGAMLEYDHKIGEIKKFDLGIGLGLIQGELEIGSSMQTMLIKDVIKEYNPETEIVLMDAPPGTSCPVVTTSADADFILLVTEPTPFGLHDLQLTIELMREIHKPFAVIINKDGIGDGSMEKYLEAEDIEIIGRIAFSKEYAANYATGKILNNLDETQDSFYRNLVMNLKEKLN